MKTFEEIEAELINQKDRNLLEIEKFKNNKEKAINFHSQIKKVIFIGLLIQIFEL